MPYSVIRVYTNAAGDTLRTDTIYLRATSNQLTTGVNPKTFYRELSTTITHETGAARVVAGIQVTTNADTIETVTGDYVLATWTAVNAGQNVICDMSDLPGIGDSV